MKGGGQGDEDQGTKSVQSAFSVGCREQRSPNEMRQLIAPDGAGQIGFAQGS